jgi:acetylornithine deacetylase/succinyl-diaminopimelate desuccinylase-like protein
LCFARKSVVCSKTEVKVNATEILSHLVAMPTDSTTAAHYVECANFIARELELCGFEVQIVDGGNGKVPKPKC